MVPKKADLAPTKIQTVTELCEELGFGSDTTRPASQLTDSIHRWRKEYKTRDGTPGTDLLDWKSRSVQEGLKEMTREFLEGGGYGAKIWPPQGIASPRDTPEYATDGEIIAELVKKLFWRQNVYAARNAKYDAKRQHRVKDDMSFESDSLVGKFGNSISPSPLLPPVGSGAVPKILASKFVSLEPQGVYGHGVRADVGSHFEHRNNDSRDARLAKTYNGNDLQYQYSRTIKPFNRFRSRESSRDRDDRVQTAQQLPQGASERSDRDTRSGSEPDIYDFDTYIGNERENSRKSDPLPQTTPGSFAKSRTDHVRSEGRSSNEILVLKYGQSKRRPHLDDIGAPTANSSSVASTGRQEHNCATVNETREPKNLEIRNDVNKRTEDIGEDLQETFPTLFETPRRNPKRKRISRERPGVASPEKVDAILLDVDDTASMIPDVQKSPRRQVSGKGSKRRDTHRKQKSRPVARKTVTKKVGGDLRPDSPPKTQEGTEEASRLQVDDAAQLTKRQTTIEKEAVDNTIHVGPKKASTGSKPLVDVHFLVVKARKPRLAYERWKEGKFREKSSDYVFAGASRITEKKSVEKIKCTLVTAEKERTETLHKDAEEDFEEVKRAFDEEMTMAFKKNRNEFKNFEIWIEPVDWEDPSKDGEGDVEDAVMGDW